MIAAKVVDFPQPVGPVIKTKPDFISANLIPPGGKFISSTVGISGQIKRAANAKLSFHKKH